MLIRSSGEEERDARKVGDESCAGGSSAVIVCVNAAVRSRSFRYLEAPAPSDGVLGGGTMASHLIASADDLTW